MNCFNFNNKQSYMDHVQSLSNGEIILQRKLMSNLLEKIQSEYNYIKTDIEIAVIPFLRKIINTKDISKANEYFKKALEHNFNNFLRYKTTVSCDLNEYSNSARDDSEHSREDSIQIIEDTYNQITSEDESGVYDKCLSLLNLIINQSAIVMYRLYHVALLDEEELKPFLTAPKVLFGGLNEKGEPDLKYSVRRYMYQIQFDIKFVENNF